MPASSSFLAGDALAIWKAGIAAVDSASLVREQIIAGPDFLEIAGVRWTSREEGRICVVGAGKAGTGMARGLEEALGSPWLARTTGWMNVPADCLQPLQKIHLHAARPAGLNEPTTEGVVGTREILSRVHQLRPQDLCIVLISGGGSALLPAPVAGISLADKQRVTRTLMSCGATIAELNCVRRSLSKIKGGGLARACRAGQIITLIISDVIGDPLDVIASGPTVPSPASFSEALNVLRHFERRKGVSFPSSVWDVLERRSEIQPASSPALPQLTNVVIGNNETAVTAAARCAGKLGYQVRGEEWDREGEAASSGAEFAERMLSEQRKPFSDHSLPGFCLISGGETTVDLTSTSDPGKGGRNQEFALAAAITWLKNRASQVALVSGGTDGEDGPTDAAGACVNDAVLEQIHNSGISPEEALLRHASYDFFARVEGLLHTGPTQTNVMDLRVGLGRCDTP